MTPSKHLSVLVVLAGLATTAALSPACTKEGSAGPKAASLNAPSYPETKRQSIEEKIHGVAVADPYRWLENIEDEVVIDWVDQQDALTRNELAKVAGRESLETRLTELYYVDTISAPVKRGERLFFTKQDAREEKAVLYYRNGGSETEHVLIDPNALSQKTGKNVSLGRWVPSWDGAKLAYAQKEDGADESTLFVIDIKSRKQLDTIPGVKYAYPQWTKDNAGFYYTWLPTDPKIPVAERPGYAEIRYHKVGTALSGDTIVHPALGNPQKFLGVSLSYDGHWLFVYHWEGWNNSEVFFKDLRKPAKDFIHFASVKGAQLSVTAHGEHFYIETTDGAPKGAIYKAKAGETDRSKWTTLVDERDDATIGGMQIIGGRMVLSMMRNASSELEIWSLDGKKEKSLALPGIGTTSGFVGVPDQNEAYFAFTSFTVPTEIYRTDVSTKKVELWNKVEIPVDTSKYETEQVWYPSKDGTKVSMFIVRARNAPKTAAPTLLYGYGGFTVSLTPRFWSGLYPWLEAGGVYAVPNLRGGGEYGEAWHQAGMRANKQNVFDDFVAAAEYLVDEGYTTKEQLAIRGGSNGGLLTGAVMTQRPDLFRAVICAVPLLDMLRYHLFGSGKTWIPEYGSAEDPEQFSWLHGYSPYHQVKENTDYPAMLMVSADHDDRVDPMHARKMVAALQHANTSEHPMYLLVERNAGHGGADMRSKRVEQYVDMYAFLFDQLGIRTN